MSHEINESELFVALSDDEQELVAGGIGTGKKTGSVTAKAQSPVHVRLYGRCHCKTWHPG